MNTYQIAFICLFLCQILCQAQAANEDLPVTIGASEYQSHLQALKEHRLQSLSDLTTKQDALSATEKQLKTAETELHNAEQTFRKVELSNDPEALDMAWNNVSAAVLRLDGLLSVHDHQRQETEDAENTWERNTIWVAMFENDYEAQSDRFAIRDAIARCDTRTCSAENILKNERFTVFQPHALKMIGVQHAYAKGLTGKGVRIGIEDDSVNYRLSEFAGRISFDGAILTYPLPFGDDYNSEAQQCQRDKIDCRVITYSSEYQLLDTLAARWAIASYGWPSEDENWFLLNEAYEEGNWLRWSKIPHVTTTDYHGTIVASVAAGRDFGIAPGATIIPIAKNFDPEGQQDEALLDHSLLSAISVLPATDRDVIDYVIADFIQSDYTHYDVINRSFGIGVFDPLSITMLLDDRTQWWGEGLRQLLPQTWRAFMQTDTHPDNRTIVVYAAGNSAEEFSGLGAGIPYYEPHVRGSQLSVMALDHDGSHAAYTNFCGPLPFDWNVDVWGRHFCLAAPGMVNAAAPKGPGYIYHEITGTSFAAPIVTGAIALLIERFRGQLGNSQIVKRVMNTANNEGRYAQSEIYGAGLLDLQAALQPVGRTITGTQTRISDIFATAIMVPQALGNLGQHLAMRGVEIASLDSLGAPFWSSPEQFIRPMWIPSLAIPSFSEPARDGDKQLHFGFTPDTYAGLLTINGIHLLMGENKTGLEQASANGFRWGFLSDNASWQGGQTKGAFGDRVRALTAWFGRGIQFDLTGAWTVHASATLAFNQAFLQSDSMLDVNDYVSSTWAVTFKRYKQFKLSVSQPLRAETGTATFNYLTGLKDGRPAYDKATVSLAPEGRELELAFTHETSIGHGRGIIRAMYVQDAGHVPGKTDIRAGVAFQLNW